MNKPTWLPDWRDINAYPDPEHTKRYEWAWEFLRRNPEYQADYESFLKSARQSITKIKFRPLKGKTVSQNLNLDDVEYSFLCASALLDKAKGNKNKLCIPREYILIVEKYGLLLVFDPASSIPPFTYEINQNIPQVITHISETNINKLSPKSPNEITAKFDLSKPITRQIDYIKGLLLSYREAIDPTNDPQKQPREMKTGNFQEYLQILDAFLYTNKKDSVLEKQVSKELYGGMNECDLDRLYKAKNRAIKLMESGYGNLAQSDFINKKARKKEGYEAGKLLILSEFLKNIKLT